MAYSLILLRADTGLPCVFYGDLYGCIEPEVDGRTFSSPASGGVLVPKLMLARKLYAYGSQLDYFDQTNCIGFTRTGHPSRSGGAGLAVVLTSGWTFASKRMYVGTRHAGERWTDILHCCWGEIIIDENGWGLFPVGPRSTAVWVNSAAEGRQFMDRFDLSAPSPTTSHFSYLLTLLF